MSRLRQQGARAFSVGDTEIDASVTIAGSAPAENASVTVTSNGYNGQPFTNQSNSRSSGPATANIQPLPTITGLSPSKGLVGAGTPVTVTGTGFTSRTTISAGANISVSNISVVSVYTTYSHFYSCKLPVRGRNQSIRVVVDGRTSTSLSFFVQIPTHFRRFDLPPDFPGGMGPVISLTNGNVLDADGKVLVPNACGVYDNFVFAMADQETPPVDIKSGTVTVTEVSSNISTTTGPPPSVSTIDLSVQVEADTQALVHISPSCPATNEIQSLDMQWKVQIGPKDIGPSYTTVTVVHVTKGNFNGTLNVTSTITTP